MCQPNMMLHASPQGGMGVPHSASTAAHGSSAPQYKPGVGQYVGGGGAGQYGHATVASMPAFSPAPASTYVGTCQSGVAPGMQPPAGGGFSAFNMRTLQQALQQQLQQPVQQGALSGMAMMGMHVPGAADVVDGGSVQRLEVSMVVPPQHVGAIIGRGGSVLQSLKVGDVPALAATAGREPTWCMLSCRHSAVHLSHLCSLPQLFVWSTCALCRTSSQ